MSQILLLNPRRKRRTPKRTKKKTGSKTTTRKRTRTAKRRTRLSAKKPVARRVAARTKGAATMAKRKIKRRAPRRNPSRAKRAAKSVGRRAGSTIGGLNIKAALKNIPLNTIGMFAAKYAAKKFGQSATEIDPASWNYASYLKGAAGAAAAGFLVNMVRRGAGQKVLEGGMSLMLYKLIQNEVISGNEFWSEQLGASEYQRSPGTIEENAEGEPYILGDDYEWYPLEGADDYRMEPMYGNALVEPGPLGDALVEPGPLGGSSSNLDDLYRRSFINR